MTKLPKIHLCDGKKCAAKGGHHALHEALEPIARIHAMRCQGICRGPVVALKVDGVMEWFERVNKTKARQRLVELLRTGAMSKTLAKRRLAKRSGTKPKK
jgi:(2Fe-2S) ferredoxin